MGLLYGSGGPGPAVEGIFPTTVLTGRVSNHQVAMYVKLTESGGELYGLVPEYITFDGFCTNEMPKNALSSNCAPYVPFL